MPGSFIVKRSMAFELLRLSQHDLLSILNKMSRVSFARSRRSTKFLNDFATRSSKSIGLPFCWPISIENYKLADEHELTGFFFKHVSFSDTNLDGPNHETMRQLVKTRQWRGGHLELTTAISAELLRELRPRFLSCDLSHTDGFLPSSVQVLHLHASDPVTDWSDFGNVQVMSLYSDDSTIGTVKRALRVWKQGQLPSMRVIETGPLCTSLLAGQRSEYAEKLREIAGQFVETKDFDVEFGLYGVRYMGMLNHKIRSGCGQALLTVFLDEALDCVKVYVQVHFNESVYKVSFPPRRIRIEDYLEENGL